MSFASLLTAGFASPVPLLISLVGLRRPGKKMASVGTFVSTLGVAIATTIVVGSIVTHNHRAEAIHIARHNRVVKRQLAETDAMMAIAAIEIAEFREDIVDESRFDIEANMLILHHIDPWGESLRFEMNDQDGLVRSAGPDKKFDTRDDIKLDLAQPATATTSAETEAPANDQLPADDF